MAFIEITSVERIDSAGEQLLAWGIDLPLGPAVIDGYFLTIAGWVVGRERAIEGMTLRLGDNLFLSCCAIDRLRPDVTEHLDLAPELRTGFEFAINVIALPSSFALTLKALVDCRDMYGEQDDAIPLAILRGTHSRPHTSFKPRRQPIALTSLGRTGTTLVMQMLASHPAIVAQRVYPFETRMAAWWLHSLTILGGHARHAESSHPDTFLRNPFAIGHNPWAIDNGPNGEALRAWLRGVAVEDLAAFCQRQIDEAYVRIAADQHEEASRFFIEKTVPTHVPRILRQLYDGPREIFLVRDFRDMFCSMASFDAKRNQNDFQRDDLDAGTFLDRMIRDLRRLVLSWEERRESAMLVRYEDLVAAPGEALQRITSYLGIDGSVETIASMMAAADGAPELLAAHRTSADAEQSIGRFRREMSSALQERSLELGSDLLAALGYEA
ncbi:MAG TPA: sulfotransferase [Thermoanaerobaculia bacterium]|nr:sulfotransferase [Thermoanaerobaculia bacterium]